MELLKQWQEQRLELVNTYANIPQRQHEEEHACWIRERFWDEAPGDVLVVRTARCR